MIERHIDYIQGIEESFRDDAAQLYDAAFGAKFAAAVPSPSVRIDLISKSLILQFAFAAFLNDQLVGLAGFHTPDGSFTGGMNYKQLVSSLGIFRGHWAALILSLYERKPLPKELLMDGIAVHPKLRGQGIGTRLLSELNALACKKGYDRIRLDVIDTNRAAQRLYERNGFVPIKTERFPYLRWLLGFSASTTMIRNVANTA